MATDLDIATGDDLPTVEMLAGDSRTLAFQVVDASGNGVDITDATVTWGLFAREYLDADADAELTGSDSAVEIVTDDRVDTTNGEFEVRLAPGATDGIWGVWYHRPEVEQAGGSVASWRGSLIIES